MTNPVVVVCKHARNEGVRRFWSPGQQCVVGQKFTGLAFDSQEDTHGGPDSGLLAGMAAGGAIG